MGSVRDEDRDITSAFERGGIEVIEEGLREMPFGEYLVERRALTRAQLLAALCEHDRHGNIALGEVIAWMGYMSWPEVEEMLAEWSALPVVDLS